MIKTGKKCSKVWVCSNVDSDIIRNLTATVKSVGYDAEVLAALSEHQYRTFGKNGLFSRFHLRCLMYIWYPVKLLTNIMFSKRHAIYVVSTNPFFAPALVSLLAKPLGAGVIHLLYDLYPDALEISGKIARNGLLSSTIGRLLRFTQKNADATVYLGDVLRKHVGLRWQKCKIEETIDIGADSDLFKKCQPAINQLKSPLKLHYGGQLGYMHAADCLVGCFKGVLDTNYTNIEFGGIITNASGVGANLFKLINHDKFLCDPPLPASLWREAIKEYHIGIVSLSPGGASVCLPSKTYAMMAGGLAIIAVCPIWSDLARIVLETGAGWVINNSKYTSLCDCRDGVYLDKLVQERKQIEIVNDFIKLVDSINANREELHKKRLAAWRNGQERFSGQIERKKWESIISCVQI